jgi:TatD DNase family protein
LALWEQYLPDARYIGEVGLDAGPLYYRSLQLQKEVFERILKACAQAGEKILSVHSVRATTAVLDLLEKWLPSSRGGIVLHWFTGTKIELRRAVDLGCYFSVNMAMVENERGRKLIAEIPSDRILTETDGPFTKVGGAPAKPADVAIVIDGVAAIRSTPRSEIASDITANLRRLLNAHV